ncbi:TetR family transcriptional regulator [Fervidicella metallireducens AeB]|uniref:TetR family transcriptional regulator n=1 Tax=Fervidicella metallireducens AeB TaxID=1403537 RepID=A0A017RVD0_9CLOT|nr:TetR/AcrR family transcriptional regulator [Fervidicella metallireducens]EYE88733.1 TetR family transcriptional regulator [Fervidicella metallireducens AeB]
MYSSFEKIPKDKQENILNICLEEFALYGYEKASTNRIVEKAGISKGLLFHYFKNKKGLYLYLYDYYTPVLLELFNKYADVNEPDIFERLKKWMVAKIELNKDNPVIFEFFKQLYTDVPEELREEIQKRNEVATANSYSMFYKGLDYSKFKTDIDLKKAMQILFWSLEKYGEQYVKENTDKDGKWTMDREVILKDLDEYIKILKFGFYK